MTKELPDDIEKDLQEACSLHERATSDYEKCVEFNKLTSDLLARLEDAGHYRLADRVMTILLDCNPKEGSSCGKASITSERVKKFCKTLQDLTSVTASDFMTFSMVSVVLSMVP